MGWTKLTCFLLSLMVLGILGKPVKKGPQHPPPQDPHPGEGGASERELDTDLEYHNYLQQVVQFLESDTEFRKKLETANISEIKSGDIAMHLEMVNHTVRTQLDEAKRQEIARLQQLAHLQLQGTSGIDLIKNAMSGAKGHGSLQKMKIPDHLDLRNPHSFEMDDLRKLILKTTADLEELDKQRTKNFKEYEMEKEYEKLKHLNELPEEERKKEEARLEALRRKHANHPKVNHPGSKDQFEEVWDKVDHLEDQDFNPKTFFYKHDLNGDFEWSIDEVDALVQLELDKVYDPRNSPEEDDLLEREEEMNRMRSHIFQEMDKDKNYRISLKEFIDYTGTDGDQPKFEKDEGWKTVDEEPLFSEGDYKKFLESHHAQTGEAQPAGDLKFQSEQLQGQLLELQREEQPQNNKHQGQQHEQQSHVNPQQVQHSQFEQQQKQHPQLNQQHEQQQQEQHVELNQHLGQQQQEQHPQLNQPQQQEQHSQLNLQQGQHP